RRASMSTGPHHDSESSSLWLFHKFARVLSGWRVAHPPSAVRKFWARSRARVLRRTGATYFQNEPLVGYAQFHCQFGDQKVMSFHEPARDVKCVGNFRNMQPFEHCAKYDLIRRLQPTQQQVNDFVRVDLGHDASLELQAVASVLP